MGRMVLLPPLEVQDYETVNNFHVQYIVHWVFNPLRPNVSIPNMESPKLVIFRRLILFLARSEA